MSPCETHPGSGLRERKKAKIRVAIQHEALRLFRRHGYEATTIEQIAEAAEISQSTYFRYFPTKEAVVVTDDYDPLIIDAIRAQPEDLHPIRAVRAALSTLFTTLTEQQHADMRERARLTLAVPELRAAAIDQSSRTIGELAEILAERTGEEFAVRVLAGAILGALIAAEYHWIEHPGTDLASRLDAALAHLESGLDL